MSVKKIIRSFGEAFDTFQQGKTSGVESWSDICGFGFDRIIYDKEVTYDAIISLDYWGKDYLLFYTVSNERTILLIKGFDGICIKSPKYFSCYGDISLDAQNRNFHPLSGCPVNLQKDIGYYLSRDYKIGEVTYL